MNVYLIGVGGQGIGLLSEALLRAADAAGLEVRGVDTHGLAQRGGVVTSHLRIGQNSHSPLVSAGEAQLVVALERHEALRGLNDCSAAGGALVYYDTEWQPIAVRSGRAKRLTADQVEAACNARGVQHHRVFTPELPDARMQNVAVLATIARKGLLPEVTPDHFRSALEVLLQGPVLESNLTLFNRLLEQDSA